MKLAIIGVGQAGGKILDRLIEYDTTHNTGFIQHAVAINSAKADLQGLSHVPHENRVLIGQSLVQGHGTGTDPETGAECARENIHEIQNAIDRGATSQIDAFLFLAGLGGGTGSGGVPVIAEHIQRIYREPVYSLGVLPTRDEGGIYNRNAVNSLQQFVDHSDNVLLFDNDAFKASGESLEGGYNEVNAEITTRFGTLLSAGEVASIQGDVAESVVDSSEIINTLGADGLTSIGYASEEVETAEDDGLLSRLFGSNDEPDLASAGDDTNRITSLVRRATLGKLTLPCEITSTSRALLIVSGPPEKLSRKGIDNARNWLENETGCREVRAGDYPLPNEDRVAILVVLSGITEVPRLNEIQSVAVNADQSAKDREQRYDDELQDFLEYDE